MQILKLRGFLFEPNDPAVYDRDSKTVLELCGRLGYKINELIDEYNRFYEEMNEKYEEAYNYMVTNLDNIIREEIPILAPGIMEELWGTDIDGLLKDMADLKAEYKYYQGINDLKQTGDKAPVGAYVKTTYRSASGDMGGALYQIVDHLEEGEVANNEDIIALGVTLDPTKWAKMVPGNIIKSTSFGTIQHAVDYAYKNARDVLVCGIESTDELNMPFSEDTPTRRIRLIGINNMDSILIIRNGVINLSDDATFVNFSFENLYIESQSVISDYNLFSTLTLDTLAGRTIDFIKNCVVSHSVVNLVNANGLNIVGSNFINSTISLETSTDCNIIGNSFIGDEHFDARMIQADSCFNLLLENNTYNASAGNSNTIRFYQVSNSTIKNDVINLMALSVSPIELNVSHYNNLENIYIGGVSGSLACYYIYGSNYNNFKGLHSNYTNEVRNGEVFNLVQSNDNYFENIELCDERGFLITNTSAGNMIKDYKKIGNAMVTLVHSVGASDNTIELNGDADTGMLSASAGQDLIHFVIPSEIKYGDTATMNDLVAYEGRVYYNTETQKIMLYDNLQWNDYSGSGGGGGSNVPVAYLNNPVSDFQPNTINGTIDSGDVTSLINICNDMISKNFNTFILVVNIRGMSIKSLSYLCQISSYDYDLLNFHCIGAYNQFVNDVTATMIDFYIAGSYTDGVVTSLDNYVGGGGGVGKILYADNSNAWTPTGDYNPATKLYVDGEDLSAYVEPVDSNETTLTRFKLRRVGKQFFMQGFITATNGGSWNTFNIKMPSSYLYENLLPVSNSSIPVGVSSLVNFGTPTSIPVYSYLSYDTTDNTIVTLKFSRYDTMTHTPVASDSIAVNISWTYED